MAFACAHHCCLLRSKTRPPACAQELCAASADEREKRGSSDLCLHNCCPQSLLDIGGVIVSAGGGCMVMGVLGKADEPHPCWQSTRLSRGLSFLSLEVPVDLYSGVSPKTRNFPPAPRWPGRVWSQFGYSQDCFAAHSSNGAGAGWSVWFCGMVCQSLLMPWDGVRESLQAGAGRGPRYQNRDARSHKVVARCH